MKAISMTKPFSVPTSQFGGGSYQSILLRGVHYVWDDLTAEFLKIGSQDHGELDIIDITRQWIYPDRKQRVGIFAPGGIGDSLLTTSVAKQIHDDTGSDIYVVTTPFHAPIYDQPFIADWLCHPARYDVLQSLDQVLSYDGIITEEGLRNRPYNDLFGDVAGIDSLRYSVPQYPGPTMGDRLRMNAILPARNGKRVGIHLRGSMWPKSWPLVYSCRLAVVLAQKGIEVLLIGSYGEFGGFYKKDDYGEKKMVDPPDGVIDMCGRMETIGDIAATIDTCDLIVCPDSGVLHMCAAMNAQAILLSGPFPTDMRAAKYPTVVGIDANVDCAPCYATRTCPNGCRGTCKAMASITPEQVEHKVDELL